MDSFSLDAVVHGVLVNIADTGVLITGESGSGKSECALELVSRGHKLVADDVIEIEKAGDSLRGRAPERFAGLLEVRDIGIVDVRDLYLDAFEARYKIDICIEFQDRDGSESLAAPETKDIEILGVKVPKFTLPVNRGRNAALLVETVARLTRSGGLKAELALAAAHDALVSNSAR